ncbi:glycosyltransferase family 39 protein [Halopenitus persicus]|uniref:Dolichyl-phosphate-mannose-protein mannosyltransferase n=1 Tax=Halopenitus persicus TaxID=1048396 RepID=A0A1H3MN53_9EURY|nr:glycosyltransferase family 39 protein [Halopenitus persicus]SDY77868.1 Dolichyl-phosphate-mannose-protein mannosyltransferase [Halopenitus persicus]
MTRSRLRDLPGQARRRVLADLREDPYLPYVLLLAVVLCGFWIWHRAPNFATRDEKSRILDVLVAYGRVLEEPSLAALREGVTWSRVPFGATFYLFGLALLPVVLAAAVLGDLEAVAALGVPSYEFGFYAAWQSVPAWIWTWSIVLVRLANVALSVGCVYLTYRIGAAAFDRRTGDLAALLLTLTFGFLTIAHEGGEDMPALFFVLLALYLALRYVQIGDETLVLVAGAAGGVAIAFKLTAVPVVPLIGLAFPLRARRADRPWHAALASLAEPGTLRTIVASALAGLLCIVLGFPTALVGAPDLVLERVFVDPVARATHTTGPDAPIWWWFLRGYLSALSIPLLVAGIGGVLASVLAIIPGLRGRENGRDGALLVLALLGTYLLLFSQWHDFRVHHLLPTFPLVALLLADRLTALEASRPAIARPLMAVLLVTAGGYAVVGVGGYADMPRDQAEDWLLENAEPDATVETYRVDFQDTAIPYELSASPVAQPEGIGTDPCPDYIQLGYRDLLYLVDDTYYRNGARQHRYIRSLLEEEYNYEIVAEFGPRPPNYVPDRAEPGSARDLLRYGVVPQTDQYADEQELAANQYTIVLERTGSCPADRDPPF